MGNFLQPLARGRNFSRSQNVNAGRSRGEPLFASQPYRQTSAQKRNPIGRHAPACAHPLRGHSCSGRKQRFVGEDAVEGGAGDVELAGGTELVAAVEVEHVLDVVADDGVEGEIVRAGDGLGLGGRGEGVVGQGEIGGADDAVGGLEERGLEDARELAHIAGPGVLKEAGEGAGAEDDVALLIAGGDALEQGLGERGDVFAALAQGRNGEADGGEAEGEVGHEQALTGHLAKRRFRRGDENGAAGRAVLQGFEDAEEQALSGRGEEVDAVEIEEAGEGGGVGIGGEPLASVTALEGGGGEGRAGVEVAGEGGFAGAVLAFNGGKLQMGGGHLSLDEQLAPGGADADEVRGGGGFGFDEGGARSGGAGSGRLGGIEWNGGLQGSQRATPP
jgi:hypothetical protein